MDDTTRHCQQPGRWPDLDCLNRLASNRSVPLRNALGRPLRFIPQQPKPTDFAAAYEPRIYLAGEVQTRLQNWHDMFNALVWLTFPTAKAAINARHFAAMNKIRGNDSPQRSPERDALTLFDEDGVIVLSSNSELLDMIREFRWKALFWERRQEVQEAMRFVVFGHALYEKALTPFVGMTGKAILLAVAADEVSRASEPDNMPAQIDTAIAAYLKDAARMQHGRELAPLPVLGIPGWYAANMNAEFYDNADYFRPGRRGRENTDML